MVQLSVRRTSRPPSRMTTCVTRRSEMMPRRMKIGGFLTLGVLATGLALAGPAVANDRLSTEHQPRAEQAIVKAQGARESLAQAQSQQTISPRQERLLGLAD